MAMSTAAARRGGGHKRRREEGGGATSGGGRRGGMGMGQPNRILDLTARFGQVSDSYSTALI